MGALERVIVDLVFQIKLLVMGFLYDEQGDVNIVSMVVLIGVAVLLAVIFKRQIKDLLDTLFGTITQNATDAVN